MEISAIQKGRGSGMDLQVWFDLYIVARLPASAGTV